MEQIVALLIPLGCGCVLPIVAIWLTIREKMNETNKRTQIVLAAIEKNPEMDIEELMRKISPKKKLLKEKLLSYLFSGCITTLLGIGLIILGFFIDHRGGMLSDKLIMTYFAGSILLAVGIAFLAHYYISKHMLAKEIEAEEKRVTTFQE